MGLLIRAVLAVAGVIAALLVATDAPGFGVVQGMVALVLIAAVVLVVALIGRK